MYNTKFIDKVRSITKEPLTAQGIQVLQVNQQYLTELRGPSIHIRRRIAH